MSDAEDQKAKIGRLLLKLTKKKDVRRRVRVVEEIGRRVRALEFRDWISKDEMEFIAARISEAMPTGGKG